MSFCCWAPIYKSSGCWIPIYKSFGCQPSIYKSFSCQPSRYKYFGCQPPIYKSFAVHPLYISLLAVYPFIYKSSSYQPPIYKSSGHRPLIYNSSIMFFDCWALLAVNPLYISLLHNKKHHRPAASCGFYRLAASCQQVAPSLLISSSHSKPVKIRLVATWYFADLLQVVETSLRVKCLTINLGHTCWQLAADLLSLSLSKQCERILIYWLDDSKATGLQQTC